MIRIAIVDDEIEAAELIAKKILALQSSMHVKLEVVIYTDGEKFLYEYSDLKYQALFLDLDMPEKSGFDISCYIRNNGFDIPIVYVTNRDDLMQKAFQYKVIGFVRKNHLDNELPYALECVLNEIRINTKTISVVSAKKKYNLKVSDIMYIESENHNLKFYLNGRDDVIKVRDTLNSYIEHAGFQRFISISSSCIVNYDYIFSIEKDSIVIQDENHTVLYISRRKIKPVKEAFLYLSRRRFL